jgi:hypothetical protein
MAVLQVRAPARLVPVSEPESEARMSHETVRLNDYKALLKAYGSEKDIARYLEFEDELIATYDTLRTQARELAEIIIAMKKHGIVEMDEAYRIAQAVLDATKEGA